MIHLVRTQIELVTTITCTGCLIAIRPIISILTSRTLKRTNSIVTHAILWTSVSLQSTFIHIWKYIQEVNYSSSSLTDWNSCY